MSSGSSEEVVKDEEHEITNPVEECKKWQKRYNKCIKKFAGGFVQGDPRYDRRNECLERFDDFQKMPPVRCRSSVINARPNHGGGKARDVYQF
ncbi:unnamed protein product [Ascophyllum nodosum]